MHVGEGGACEVLHRQHKSSARQGLCTLNAFARTEQMHVFSNTLNPSSICIRARNWLLLLSQPPSVKLSRRETWECSGTLSPYKYGNSREYIGLNGVRSQAFHTSSF